MSGVFLRPDDLAGWVVATDAMVAQAIESIEAQAMAAVPRLSSVPLLEVEAQVKGILRMAVVGLVQSRGGRITQTASGPFSAAFARGSGGLTDDDIAALRAICGETQHPKGLPRGTFPTPGDYAGLFASPRRRLL